MKFSIRERVANHLNLIYGADITLDIIDRCMELLEHYREKIPRHEGNTWDNSEIVLITYGDTINESWQRPLLSLRYFLNKYLYDIFSTVHILPFFPYSSDDGFSVIDYHKVNPELGTLGDIRKIMSNFKLMFDLVINHVSVKSKWFQQFLKGEAPGKDFFIVPDAGDNLTKVIRPRSSPLLTPFETASGIKHVWTTFSADQVDLNFKNPRVFFEILKVLMHYLEEGARVIRLDAIAFLWKEPGTNCLHLPKTHEFVRLFRTIMEHVAPGSILLTETNVPNKENLSYFGKGDEARIIYQFSLPPLLLHALYAGTSKYLTAWARSVPEPPEGCTYFNFTASHDGIGVRPLEGVLPPGEIEDLIQGVMKNGGLVSTRKNQDGKDIPYELNITYLDALKTGRDSSDQYHIQRFICSQLIMLALKGIPGIYIHSILGTPNDHEGVKNTGINRSINRMKWDLTELEHHLKENPVQSGIFNILRKHIHKRLNEKAFHPDGTQEIPDYGSRFFVITRKYEGRQVVCISNVTSEKVTFRQFNKFNDTWYIDMLSAQRYSRDKNEVVLEPYQTVWLTTI
ncbi:MAG: sugar phosphorylase [Bacteroidota bacterium]